MRNGLRVGLAVLAASTFTSMLADPAAAVVELTPFVGIAHPTKSEYSDLAVPLIIDLGAGAAYGVRATWWTQPRIGLEASAAGAGLPYHLTGGSEIVTSATLFQADARARIRLNSPSADNHFDLIGGFGLSDLQTPVDAVFKSSGLDLKSRTAWVLGLGTTLGLSPKAGLRVDFEDHIHKTHVEIDKALTTIPSQDRTMNDLMFTVGVVVPLGKH